MKNNDLILQKLSKSYHGQVVFSDLSLALSPGNAYCLMAPSGTGKTTLFRILMGLETPDSGTIDGLKNLKISAVFQEDRLLEGYDVLTNLRFVCRQRLSDAELSAYAATLLPQNALSQPVCEFSGGMKRRLSLLRALLVPFDLLILDEPFNGLDSENRKKAAALVRNRAQDKILLFAAHTQEDAALLDAEILCPFDSYCSVYISRSKGNESDKNFHYNSLYPEHTKLKISKRDTDTSTGQAAAEPTFHPMTESLQLI